MKKTFNHEFVHEFEEVDISGGCYLVEATIGFDAERVDNGIGPYEFWGARGTDIHIETEVSDYAIISIDDARDEDDKPVTGITIETVENWLDEVRKNTPYHDRMNPARWLDEAVQREAEGE